MHEITLVTPFPAGEGGRGDGGKKVNQRQGWQATRKAHPRRVLDWQVEPVRTGSVAGMQGAKPLA